MKKFIFIAIIIPVSLLLFCIFTNINNIKYSIVGLPSVKVSYSPENMEQLIDDTKIIVVGEVTGNKTEISYGGVDFYKCSVKIKDIFKGLESTKTEITLLQTLCQEDPIVKKGDKVLLFLRKYEGPVTSDSAYVINGLYQGQYILDNNKLKLSTDKFYNLNLKTQMLNTDLDKVKKLSVK